VTGIASRKTRFCRARSCAGSRSSARPHAGSPSSSATTTPEVPWREAFGMRNRVTHGYFDIDLDVVWNTIMSDLPALEEAVARWLPLRTLPSERPPPSD
jgi:hypothetical protein